MKEGGYVNLGDTGQIVLLDTDVSAEQCSACHAPVTHREFVHIHSEKRGRCDWLCPDCWARASLMAVQWGIERGLHEPVDR